MLVMLCLLGALCWLLYYLMQADPFTLGPFFAVLMTAMQLYLIWRMVRWGKKRVHGTGSSRLRTLPFPYRRKPARGRHQPSPEAEPYVQ
jgi:hypothetical protein